MAQINPLNTTNPSLPSEPVLHFQCTGGEHYYFHPSRILFIEADNNNCYIAYFGQVWHVPYPLAMMKELLPDYFLQVHRRFLVNRHEICLVRPCEVLLSDGTSVPVSERRYHWLLEVLEPSHT